MKKEVTVQVEVDSRTVQWRDVITIGEQPMKVVDVIKLSGRATRLRFTSGETLTMSARTRFTVTRAARGCSE